MGRQFLAWVDSSRCKLEMVASPRMFISQGIASPRIFRKGASAYIFQQVQLGPHAYQSGQPVPMFISKTILCQIFYSKCSQSNSQGRQFQMFISQGSQTQMFISKGSQFEMLLARIASARLLLARVASPRCLSVCVSQTQMFNSKGSQFETLLARIASARLLLARLASPRCLLACVSQTQMYISPYVCQPVPDVCQHGKPVPDVCQHGMPVPDVYQHGYVNSVVTVVKFWFQFCPNG